MSTYVSLAELDGDLALKPGRRGLLLATAGDKIVQNIKQRLEMFEGEWFLDLSKGTPYYRSILGQKPRSIPVIKSVFRQRVADTAGVVEVLSVEASFDSTRRKLTVPWKARIAEPTSDGALIGSGLTFFLLDQFGNTLVSGTDTLVIDG